MGPAGIREREAPCFQRPRTQRTRYMWRLVSSVKGRVLVNGHCGYRSPLKRQIQSFRSKASGRSWRTTKRLCRKCSQLTQLLASSRPHAGGLMMRAGSCEWSHRPFSAGAKLSGRSTLYREHPLEVVPDSPAGRTSRPRPQIAQDRPVALDAARQMFDFDRQFGGWDGQRSDHVTSADEFRNLRLSGRV